MTNVYKIELLVIDHDNIGPDEVKEVIESTHYPNHCIYPDVMGIEAREIEWSDDHPLNCRGCEEEYRRLFAAKENKNNLTFACE